MWDFQPFGRVPAKEVNLKNSIRRKSSVEGPYLLIREFVLRPGNIRPSGLGSQICTCFLEHSPRVCEGREEVP